MERLVNISIQLALPVFLIVIHLFDFGNGDHFRILPGIFLCGQAQAFDKIQIVAVINKLDVHWQINRFVRRMYNPRISGKRSEKSLALTAHEYVITA